MKPIHLLITALLMLCAPLRAQDGLATSKAFRGEIVPRDQLVEVRVKGQPIRKYDLTFYHSVTFPADEARRQTVKALVDADYKEAIGSETTRRTKRETTILQLPPKGGLSRFLCHICEPGKVTLVYMEGHVKDIKQLRKAINDNN